MAGILLRRVLITIPIVLGMTLVSFAISHSIPADPVVAHLGQTAVDRPEIVAAFNQKWGLDRPLHEQYLRYIAALAQGDLGVSIRTHSPVADDLARHLPASAELAVTASALSIALGLPFGVVSAIRRERLADQMLRVLSLIGVSTPVFWLSLVALFVFYFKLGWLPGPGRLDPGMTPPVTITGMYTLDSALQGQWDVLLASLRHLILPSAVLAMGTVGLVTRITRSSMLDVLAADYVRTARGKGLGERSVIYRHVFRNALIPIVTVVGLSFGEILAGTVLVETIFSWPGIGRYAFQATTSLDFPAIMGVTAVIALIFITVNVATDLFYVFADPRLRTA